MSLSLILDIDSILIASSMILLSYVAYMTGKKDGLKNARKVNY